MRLTCGLRKIQDRYPSSNHSVGRDTATSSAPDVLSSPKGVKAALDSYDQRITSRREKDGDQIRLRLTKDSGSLPPDE